MNTDTASTTTPPDFDDDFLEWEERDESVSYLTHCIAGSIAGITEHVTMLPFDTVKTHMQVFEGKYTAVQTAKRLYRSEGLKKFWRGASVLASGCIPAHAMYFSVYELSKTKLLPKFHDRDNTVYPYAYALTGVMATAMHDLILTPFDMLKQRAQLAPAGLTSLSSLTRYVVQNEGLTSLYRSYPITLLMNVPQAAVIVSVNESLKVLYRPEKGHNVFSYFMCAAFAGSIAAIVTIPLDNIKTKLQTQNFFQESRKEPEKLRPTMEKKNVKSMLVSFANRSFFAPKSSFVTIKEPTYLVEPEIKYKDILSTAKTIFREEGIRGFVKGAFPRIIAQAPASAISWTTYEMIKKLFKSSKSF